MLKPFDRPKVISRVVAICRRAVSPYGYEGTGRTWKLINATSARLINLQTSSKDLGTQLTFTFNLGVFFPEIYQARHDRLPEPPLQESECCPRERIGSLFFGGDKWWTVKPDTNVDVLADELEDVLTGKAIPWLARFETPESVFEDVRKRKQYFDAAVCALALERDDVREWTQCAIDAAPHGLSARNVEIWARDHGVEGFAENQSSSS